MSNLIRYVKRVRYDRSVPTGARPVYLGALLFGLTACAAVDMLLDSPADGRLTRCPSTVKVTLKAGEPRFTVMYTEPRIASDAAPSLVKTTIYVDTGEGPTRVREVAASNPQGGGEVSEVITVPWADDMTVTVCVTGTDASGREGPPTP
jgi:hypothetical protein